MNNHKAIKNRSNSKKSKEPDRDLELSPGLQEALRSAAREAAGKPLESGPDSPLSRIIGQFVEEALQAEMQEHLGYERYQRRVESEEEADDSEDRSIRESKRRSKNSRNGYSKKRLKTSVGTTEIAVPRDRQGSFEPLIVPKYGSLSQEISSRIIHLYGSGLSSREVAEHISELYQIEVSSSLVSNLVQSIDPQLQAWRQRRLEPIAAVLYLDALHVKMRQKGRVVVSAVYVASAYSEAGVLEVVGLWIAPEDFNQTAAESSAYWYEAMLGLKERGIEDVLMVAIDGLPGLAEAVSTVWPKAEIFPCMVHLVRSTLRHLPQDRRRPMARSLRAIYQAPTYEAAELALQQAHEEWDSRYASALKRWDEQMPLLKNLWRHDPVVRKIVYTTNPQENIIRQARKGIKTRSSFPSSESALRLMTMIVQRINHRYHQRQARPDWGAILGSLQRAFKGRIPIDWGLRLRD